MKKALLLMMISLLCVAFLTASGLAESRKYIHPAPVFSFEDPTNYQAGTVFSNQKHSAEVLAICMTLNLKQVENRNETGI